MKKLLVLLLSLAMVLGFGACSESEKSFPPVVETKDTGEYPYTPVSIYNAKNEKIGELEQSGVIFPTDDGFVYSVRVDDRVGLKTSGGTSDMEYYLYTASTGEKVKIGAVDNQYIMSGRNVLLHNHLFFFVVTSTEEEGSVSHLLDLDLENHSMSEVYSGADVSAANPISGVGDSLYIAEYIENGARIQEYNLTTKEMKTLMQVSYDTAGDEKEILKNMYANEDTICLLVLETEGEDSTHLRMDVYDREMQLMGSKYISGISKEDLTSDMYVRDFSFADGILYCQVGLSGPFIGKVIDEGLVKYSYPDEVTKSALETVPSLKTKLLYDPTDANNTLYLVDMGTGDMKKASFSAKEDLYMVSAVYRDTNGNLLIRMMGRDPETDKKLSCLYYIKESDLKFS